MIGHRRPWCMIPNEPIISLLPELRWQNVGGLPASSNAAALIVYVALNFVAEREEMDDGSYIGRASLSYSEISEATGLSRVLVMNGLKRLIEYGLIVSTGSTQKRSYLIPWGGRRWFKLPCRAILREGKIAPFHNFTLRSKRDLHALKLYLYFASVRNNSSSYSMAAHSTIHERTGIPEANIRAAHSLLLSVGLLAAIDREYQLLLKRREPNKYYLTGYQVLWNDNDTATPDVMVTNSGAISEVTFRG